MSKLLITGGTGSFGKALLNKYLNTSKFTEIRVFSRDEKKQDELRKSLKSTKVKFYIGDVRDISSLDNVINGIDFIFHAAALKQVPSCEFFPLEAVKTNILGTNNVLTTAKNKNVKKVVVLSTDKAAYPINAMGMSKALMEKVMVANSRDSEFSKSVLCGTRYGNVMASRGSVIPLFIDQIKAKKDITITNPDMTRFMMNLDNAVDLVMHAFEKGNNGDIFVQKSPAATIKTLAQALLELYGSKSKIKNIGIRHGEKMYETLVTKEEMIKSEDQGEYFKILPDNRSLNYDQYFSKGTIKSSINEYNSSNTKLLDVKEMKKLLLDLPEVKSDLKI
ncbi:MAG: polysaccharide biosynthesis protein [Pelagibacteraceae bacterium]|jgi:UDP-N-acetylglucosamine 4,6-dehydratase/5-epimerase|nr:polysaccharide biosynthesis protein [Pelagibacteraceae bacterium]MBT6170896.1 polysaccharide biosynthesis protein [Flavobacteriaceae bacterium]MBT6447560.1 polysaccharide biosynthesis protein [Flavobacteriaceae bacterium]